MRFFTVFFTACIFLCNAAQSAFVLSYKEIDEELSMEDAESALLFINQNTGWTCSLYNDQNASQEEIETRAATKDLDYIRDNLVLSKPFEVQEVSTIIWDLWCIKEWLNMDIENRKEIHKHKKKLFLGYKKDAHTFCNYLSKTGEDQLFESIMAEISKQAEKYKKQGDNGYEIKSLSALIEKRETLKLALEFEATESEKGRIVLFRGTQGHKIGCRTYLDCPIHRFMDNFAKLGYSSSRNSTALEAKHGRDFIQIHRQCSDKNCKENLNITIDESGKTISRINDLSQICQECQYYDCTDGSNHNYELSVMSEDLKPGTTSGTPTVSYVSSTGFSYGASLLGGFFTDGFSNSSSACSFVFDYYGCKFLYTLSLSPLEFWRSPLKYIHSANTSELMGLSSTLAVRGAGESFHPRAYIVSLWNSGEKSEMHPTPETLRIISFANMMTNNAHILKCPENEDAAQIKQDHADFKDQITEFYDSHPEVANPRGENRMVISHPQIVFEKSSWR